MNDKSSTQATYSVGVAIHSAVGDQPVVVNQGGGSLDPLALAQLVAAARVDPAGQEALLRQILGKLDHVAGGVDQLLLGQARLLLRYEQGEQRVLGTLITQMDLQQSALMSAILDVLESGGLAADELDRHLSAIDAALAEVNAHAAQIADRQLAASAQRVAELASAPGLDAKHKLKLTIPIIPVLLSYEGAFELGSKLDLAKAWQALLDRVGRSERGDIGLAASDQV